MVWFAFKMKLLAIFFTIAHYCNGITNTNIVYRSWCLENITGLYVDYYDYLHCGTPVPLIRSPTILQELVVLSSEVNSTKQSISNIQGNLTQLTQQFQLQNQQINSMNLTIAQQADIITNQTLEIANLHSINADLNQKLSLYEGMLNQSLFNDTMNQFINKRLDEMISQKSAEIDARIRQTQNGTAMCLDNMAQLQQTFGNGTLPIVNSSLRSIVGKVTGVKWDGGKNLAELEYQFNDVQVQQNPSMQQGSTISFFVDGDQLLQQAQDAKNAASAIKASMNGSHRRLLQSAVADSGHVEKSSAAPPKRFLRRDRREF